MTMGRKGEPTPVNGIEKHVAQPINLEECAVQSVSLGRSGSAAPPAGPG